MEILTAEVEEINQMIIEEILTEIGHSVTITCDGKELVEKYK